MSLDIRSFKSREGNLIYWNSIGLNQTLQHHVSALLLLFSILFYFNQAKNYWSVIQIFELQGCFFLKWFISMTVGHAHKPV